MNTYTLSKDYEALYELVKAGAEIACFVDYESSVNEQPPIRDICRCRMTDYNHIDFGCRGRSYGGTYPYETKTDFAGDEKKAFIWHCEVLNVEYIHPSAAKEEAEREAVEFVDWCNKHYIQFSSKWQKKSNAPYTFGVPEEKTTTELKKLWQESKSKKEDETK